MLSVVGFAAFERAEVFSVVDFAAFQKVEMSLQAEPLMHAPSPQSQLSELELPTHLAQRKEHPEDHSKQAYACMHSRQILTNSP